MKKIISTLILSLFVIVAPVHAGPGGPGHSHSISAKKAEKLAMAKVSALVKKKKIDASWSGMKPAKVEMKVYGKHKQWVIVFENPGLKDPAKRKLFIFYSKYGKYLATNYTGK